MLDEFDDDVEDEEAPQDGERGIAMRAVRPLVPRLVSRLYGAAAAPLRTRMLACLVQPLGSLGLTAVASGAFAQLLYRRGEMGSGIQIGDLAGYSNDQVFELARFVEQVSPDAIQQVAALLADNPLGISAFSAAVAILLACAVKGLRPVNARRRKETGSPNASWQDAPRATHPGSSVQSVPRSTSRSIRRST